MKTEVDQPAFAQVLSRGWVKNDNGDEISVVGSVSLAEAELLHDLVVDHRFTTGLETGIARGISTLALTEAFRETGGSLIGFDPCQESEHGNAALETLKEFGLDPVFTHHPEPAQSGIPRLPEARRFDFAFVDDVHNFQHRFTTFVHIDQRLEVGGIVAFHDLWLPSMKKLLRYIDTLGTYQLIKTPTARPSFSRRTRLVAGATLKRKPHAWTWPNGFSNLLVLRKVGEFDKDFLWHEDF